MTWRTLLASTIAASLALVGAGCGGGGDDGGDGGGQGGEQVRAAWVLIGPPGDGGWNYQHDLGRKAVEEELGDQVETTVVENVPETPGEATRVIRSLAQQGHDIIFTTSFGYMDPTLNVAQQFPDVKFEHCSGFKSDKNMANYFGAMEEARYLSGMVAGRTTKKNVLGYVAAFPIPEVVRGINAFTMGVREVNPKARVKVVWTSTWFDPSKERAAAESLLDAGADVLAQHQDSPATGQAAQARGAFWVGYDSDMRRFAPKAFLTAPVWDWGPYYIERVKAVLDGTWETHTYYGDMADGLIKLASPSELVDDKTKTEVAEKEEAIKADEFEVLAGPIKDQSGKVRVAEGETMSLEDALAWDWFVEGVEGSIPKQ
jgi:basic membrane protein A